MSDNIMESFQFQSLSGNIIKTKDIFFQLTDDDLVMLQNEGHLKSICNALSIDLQSKTPPQNIS
mgnify:FL=1|tara:strand:+ start:99 stop:290 length:192 start_codon:yes stop_codon:yes gene_type:complete